ncbi:MAG: DinB family protein [Ginsengibacter sp.]
MKEVFVKYAAYNFWANKILLGRLVQIPTDVLHKDMGSSFGSIYKTLVHTMEVESIWWQRIKLAEHVLLPEKDPEEDFEVLSKKIIESSKQWSDWVSNATENNITHVFGYYNTKKAYFKQPVYEVLLHLFNHQTYHRGQIITMLRQSGIDKIPATDFIVFSRKK